MALLGECGGWYSHGAHTFSGRNRPHCLFQTSLWWVEGARQSTVVLAPHKAGSPIAGIKALPNLPGFVARSNRAWGGEFRAC